LLDEPKFDAVFGSKGGGEQHADINIFSVASGHLYERMLNIMMVSVTLVCYHLVGEAVFAGEGREEGAEGG
jgi:hypothetical protein